LVRGKLSFWQAVAVKRRETDRRRAAPPGLIAIVN
jgi:hypothetical protein